MARLHAQLASDRPGKTTRSAQHVMEAFVQSEHGRLSMTVSANGQCRIEYAPVRDRERDGAERTLLRGNLEEGRFECAEGIEALDGLNNGLGNGLNNDREEVGTDAQQ